MRILVVLATLFFLCPAANAAQESTHEDTWESLFASFDRALSKKIDIIKIARTARDKACGLEHTAKFNPQCHKIYSAVIKGFESERDLLEYMRSTKNWPESARRRVLEISNPVYKVLDVETEKLWQLAWDEYPPPPTKVGLK